MRDMALVWRAWYASFTRIYIQTEYFSHIQWPYTYDSCDVGTAPNQTINGLPHAATVDGDHLYNDALSYLPGQKLSRCTCDGESHPGPKHADGTYVGRSAPEIDVLEAQMGGTPLTGEVSQSAQWAVSIQPYFNNPVLMLVHLSLSTGRIFGIMRPMQSLQTHQYLISTDSKEIFSSRRLPSLQRQTNDATSMWRTAIRSMRLR